MSLYNESLSKFRKVAPLFRYFMLFYVILAMLPIHTFTGSNIQSIVADGLMGRYTNFSRVIWSILFVLGCITNDTMLVSGLVFFVFWDSDKNKDKKDQGHRYV